MEKSCTIQDVFERFYLSYEKRNSPPAHHLNKENKKCYFIQALNKHNKRKQADLWSIIFHKSVVKVVFL